MKFQKFKEQKLRKQAMIQYKKFLTQENPIPMPTKRTGGKIDRNYFKPIIKDDF